jgi:TolB-like protein
MEERSKTPPGFLAELKRRKVYRVAVVYLAVVFLTLQIIDLLIPATTLPEWVDSFLLAIAIMGFPVAVIAAWAFELTPEGVKWTQEVSNDGPGKDGGRPAWLVMGSIVLFLLAFATWWYVAEPNFGDSEITDRSIAVLPFETLGSDHPNAFTEGIHLGVLTQLSNVSGLDIISRTSVMAVEYSDKTLPDIARSLGAAWVVRAEVQEAGNKVQINARLIDAQSDRQVWAENYQRTLTADNVFDIQSELSLAIIEALHARLTPIEKARVEQRPTVSLEAYGLHALGRSQLDRRDAQGMQSAVRYFEQAIALDPDYTLAWVGLADSLTLLYDYHIDRRERLMVRAGEAVERALELDPLSAEAYASLGLYEYAQQNAAESIMALTRAVELKPNYADAQSWLAWVQQLHGDAAAGLQSARRAVTVNPLSGEAVSNLTLSFLTNGDFEKALAQSRHNQTILPSWPTAKFYEGLALYHLGRFTEVQPLLENVNVDWTDYGAESLVALSLLAAGDEAGARDMLTSFEDSGDPFSVGLVYLALGETEAAFARFERVTQWHAWPVLAMRYFFPEVLGPQAGNPRYQGFFREMAADWGI